jgi:hypothetical protein
VFLEVAMETKLSRPQMQTTPQAAPVFASLHEEYKEWAAQRARAGVVTTKSRYEGSTTPALLDTLFADRVRTDLCVECLHPHHTCTC